ncbi:MAG: TetR/AcrR family transcriptional regulator [Deltaproteobacteria bacterium]|nr:TetR/AcrR family transcriptional regulator [Deltaproteobacteria bacterium]
MSARGKILQAADTLFGKIGFDATTTREIAKISNTNKSLIHYHFKNKEGLFQSVLDHYFENLSDTLQNVLLGREDIEDRLEHVINVYLDFLEQNKNYIRIVQREITGGKNMDRVIQHMIQNFQMVIKVIRKAYPKTRSGELVAERLVISFYGMIITHFTCSGVLEHLLKTDLKSKETIQARKNHLLAMADIIIKAIKE